MAGVLAEKLVSDTSDVKLCVIGVQIRKDGNSTPTEVILTAVKTLGMGGMIGTCCCAKTLCQRSLPYPEYPFLLECVTTVRVFGSPKVLRLSGIGSRKRLVVFHSYRGPHANCAIPLHPLSRGTVHAGILFHSSPHSIHPASI